MTDAGKFNSDYFAAGNRIFVAGDLSAFGDLLADDVQFNGAAIGTLVGKAAVLDGLQKLLDSGWTGHHVLSISAVGNLHTSTYRNDFKDAPSVHNVGVIELNEQGKIQRVWTFKAS